MQIFINIYANINSMPYYYNQNVWNGGFQQFGLSAWRRKHFQADGNHAFHFCSRKFMNFCAFAHEFTHNVPKMNSNVMNFKIISVNALVWMLLLASERTFGMRTMGRPVFRQ